MKSFLKSLVIAVVISLIFINSPIGKSVREFFNNPFGINKMIDEFANQNNLGF